VTAKNASTINGMMEVAGDSAHLIIANPNGITTQGAGFINAEKGTLTTGTPNLDSAGALTGYSVSGGAITVGGLKVIHQPKFCHVVSKLMARYVLVNFQLLLAVMLSTLMALSRGVWLPAERKYIWRGCLYIRGDVCQKNQFNQYRKRCRRA
jgi:hypothetical protein